MELPVPLPFLPLALTAEVASLPHGRVAELRLRAGRHSALTVYREGRLASQMLRHITAPDALRSVLSAVCGGSVYAHEGSMCEGYVTLPSGVRVGVGGRAVAENGRVRTVSAVHTLVFRFPTPVFGAADGLYRFFGQSEGGILLFSAPGGGKTTLLRDFVRQAGRHLRVAVIDTRGEFFDPDADSLAELLIGYPKAVGAEIAVRTLSPEVLVLDEIGEREASALADLTAFGVRTVASAHGTCAEELLSRAPIHRLFSAGLFQHLYDVKKNSSITPKGGVPL